MDHFVSFRTLGFSLQLFLNINASFVVRYTEKIIFFLPNFFDAPVVSLFIFHSSKLLFAKKEVQVMAQKKKRKKEKNLFLKFSNSLNQNIYIAEFVIYFIRKGSKKRVQNHHIYRVSKQLRTLELLQARVLMPGTKDNYYGAPHLIHALHEQLVLGKFIWNFRRRYGTIGNKFSPPAQVLEKQATSLFNIQITSSQKSADQ